MGSSDAHTLRRADSGSRRQPIKKAISRAPNGPSPSSVRQSGRMLHRPTPCAVAAVHRPPGRSPRSLLVLVVAACGPADAPAARRRAPRRPRRPSARRRRPRHRPRPTPRRRAPARARCRRDLRRDRGSRSSRSAASSRTRPVQREIIDEAELRAMHHRGLRQGQPAGLRRRQRAAVQGARPDPGGRRPARADARPPRAAASPASTATTRTRCTSSREPASPGANERITFAHEYDHALQDQNFDGLHGPGRDPRPDRPVLARQAVYEGDATLLMTQWAIAEPRPGRARTTSSAASSDPAAQAAPEPDAADPARDPALPVHDRARPSCQPAQTAGRLARRSTRSTTGCPSRPSRSSIPTSTRPTRRPVAVDAARPTWPTQLGPAGPSRCRTRSASSSSAIWLREAGVAGAAADDAAAGWGGDRLAVARGPRRRLGRRPARPTWDTAADAAAFETAATTALGEGRRPGQVLAGAGGKTRWVVVARTRRPARRRVDRRLRRAPAG